MPDEPRHIVVGEPDATDFLPVELGEEEEVNSDE
jgi:hypothetical protein